MQIQTNIYFYNMSIILQTFQDFFFAFLLFLMISISTTNLELLAQDNFRGEKRIDQQFGKAARQKGGKFFTTSGMVRALVVFVRFKDDNFESENKTWPVDGRPVYFHQVVDSLAEEKKQNGSLTHLFREMSFGKLTIIGDTYQAVTERPKSWYLRHNKNYGYINKEILVRLDSVVNYANYDQWTFGRNYRHQNKPDGIVDLIIMIHRENMPPKMHPGNGIASLGYSGKPVVVENGDLQIKLAFPGSGMSLESGYRGKRVDWYAHEIGHKYFGSGHSGYHRDKQTTNNKSFWGLQIGNGHMVNAYERERLGWFDLPVITEDSLEIILGDFITTGDAYRIPIPGAQDESFILENHQQLSLFDRPNKYGDGKGVYIYHVKGNGNHPRFDIESAEGRFDWENPYWIHNPWETDPLDSIPVFKRDEPNPSGYDGFDALPTTKKIEHKIFAEDFSGKVEFTRQLYGSEFAPFTFTDKHIFSPKSNPNSHPWDDETPSGVKIEIVGEYAGSQGESIYRVKIKLNSEN